MAAITQNQMAIFMQQLINSIDKLTEAVRASGLMGAAGETSKAGDDKKTHKADGGEEKSGRGLEVIEKVPLVGDFAGGLKDGFSQIGSLIRKEVGRAVYEPVLDTYKAQQQKPYEKLREYAVDSANAGVALDREEIKRLHSQFSQIGKIESMNLAMARQEGSMTPKFWNEFATFSTDYWTNIFNGSKGFSQRQSMTHMNARLNGE